jgi:alpha-L-arabinofuranosidase
LQAITRAASTPQAVRVDIKGLASVESKGQSVAISAASPDDTNSAADATKITPKTAAVDGLGQLFTGRFRHIPSPSWR